MKLYYRDTEIDNGNMFNLGVDYFGIAFGLMKNRKLYISYPLSHCRGYLGENLWYKKVKKTCYSPRRAFLYPIDWKIEEGKTYTILNVEQKRVKNVHNNLKWLNDKEEKAKVQKSIIKPTKYTNCFVIVGDKRWKDSCWKYMLYSYYVKCLMYTNPENGEYSYNHALKSSNGNGGTTEDSLLSNVKMKPKKEIFDVRLYGIDYNTGMHDREGFHSICIGRNIPMARLLGIKMEEKDFSWPLIDGNYNKQKKMWRKFYDLPETDPNAWTRGTW